MNRMYRLTFGENGSFGVEEVVVPKRQRKDHSLGLVQRIVKAVLVDAYRAVRSVKHAKRDVKEGLAATAIMALLFPLFCEAGAAQQLEAGVDIARAGTALMQATAVAVALVYGHRIIHDVLVDVRKMMKRK